MGVQQAWKNGSFDTRALEALKLYMYDLHHPNMSDESNKLDAFQEVKRCILPLMRGLTERVTQLTSFKKSYARAMAAAEEPRDLSRVPTSTSLLEWQEALASASGHERKQLEFDIRESIRRQRHAEYGPRPDRWQVELDGKWIDFCES